MNLCSGDYKMDGFVIFNNENIERYKHGPDEKFKEKVLKLKGWPAPPLEEIPLNDLKTIMDFLTWEYGIFQIATNDENMCFLGRLEEWNEDYFILYDINTRAKWSRHMQFGHEEVRFIEFDTDYINSLILMNKAYQNRIAKKHPKII